MRIFLFGFFILAAASLIALFITPTLAVYQVLLNVLCVLFTLYSVVLVLFFAFKKQPAGLARLKKDLQQAHIAFLRNMTHELRTPLNGVIGMSDLLKETPLNYEQIDYLETIRNSSETLLSIVNDILDLSRLHAQKFSITPTRVQLYTLVDSVFEQFYQSAGDKQLDLIPDFDPSIPALVYADESRITQILHGLVRNAIKFTSSGYVKLKAELKNSGASTVSVCFSVEDTGIGMDEKTIKTIYESFTQADSNDTRKYGGTGTGLTLCKKILNLMGSDLKLESTRGKGTKFSFTVNFKVESPGAEKSDNSSKPGIAFIGEPQDSYLMNIGRHCGYRCEAFTELKSDTPSRDNYRLFVFRINELSESFSILPVIKFGEQKIRSIFCLENMNMDFTQGDNLEFYLHNPVSGRKFMYAVEKALNDTQAAPKIYSDKINILLAEDDSVNQYIFKRMLERINCSVQIANNGKEAIEYFVSGNYDLVLMDSQMPEMTGSEALAEIKKINTSNIPVVVLTGMASPDDISNFKTIGFDDFLAKPAKADELADIIYKWVEKKHPVNCYSEFDFNEMSIRLNTGKENISRKLFWFMFIAEQFLQNSSNSNSRDKYLPAFQVQAREVCAGKLALSLDALRNLKNENEDFLLKKIRLQYEKVKLEFSHFLNEI